MLAFSNRFSNTTLECTYNQPSNRKRLPDVRRVENKLKCAELIINAIMPGIDIYSPDFNLAAFLDGVHKTKLTDPASLNTSFPEFKLAQNGIANILAVKGLNNEIDEETGLPKSSGTSIANDIQLNAVYSPQSTLASSPNGLLGREIKIILPPKNVASELIEAVWDNACVLFRFYHRPSFIRDLDLLYETDPDDYTNKQYKILPLVYSIMAVGVLFSMDKCERLGFKDVSEGYKYFVAARKLIDIADARDTYAIQSIVMMIIFLQCSARLSTCYSYIGVALRSSLRAGLHRKVAHHFDPIESETRKRLFWTIRKMDIYVNAMLGLPRSISEDDFDQDLPEEIDDENITEDAYYPQSEGKISSAGIANAHTRLITILSHIMKNIYPVKAKDSSFNTHSKVLEMEVEIRDWIAKLPVELKPDTFPPPQYLKANRLLNLALCHVQIVLYRPFIHYCSPKFRSSRESQAKTGSAMNCIAVSRRAMYIAHELTSKKMLNGAYWFSIYTIFFSVACLVYYVHENPNDPEAENIRKDAEIGKNALTSLKDASVAAQRTYNLLNTLFEQLNRRTAKMPMANDSAAINQQSEFGASVEGDATGITISEDPSQTPVRKYPDIQQAFIQPTPPVSMTGFSEPSLPVEPSVSSNSNGNHNNYSTPITETPLTTTSSVTESSPQTYLPGIMDQVDSQLFGRFLPPYMMSEQQQDINADWQAPLPAQPPLQQQQLSQAPRQPPITETPTNTPVILDRSNPALDLGVGDTMHNKRFSFSDIFTGQSKVDWENFLGQQSELSGLNSFMQ